MRAVFFLVASWLALSAEPAAGAASAMSMLVGTWVQDQTGPVLTHERVLRFKADGSYEFLFTVRNTGSTNRKVLAQERGRFAIQGNRLVFSPRSGTPRAFPWRIEKDPYVGDLRLVLVLPDGVLDIYYRK